MYIYSIVNRSL